MDDAPVPVDNPRWDAELRALSCEHSAGPAHRRAARVAGIFEHCTEPAAEFVLPEGSEGPWYLIRNDDGAADLIGPDQPCRVCDREITRLCPTFYALLFTTTEGWDGAVMHTLCAHLTEPHNQPIDLIRNP